ncbi:MAG: efflux RND transporter periplasmic adaptor subunit [Pseudobdellovibrionaceae bacterium]
MNKTKIFYKTREASLMFILTGAAFLSVISCTKKEETTVSPVVKIDADQVEVNDASSLKVETITEKPFPLTVEFNGRITVPDKDIFSVSSRVMGRLESLHVSVGDRVQKGQTLATLWSPDLATTAEEYAMAKKEGGPLLKLTEAKLHSLGLSPGEAVEGRTTFALHSPIDGVVLEKKMNPGGSLNAGDIILTVGKIGSLQFVGDLPSELAIKVKKGMSVIFDDIPKQEAAVESVSPISDPTTHLVKVRITFKNSLPKDVPQESFLKSRIVLNEIKALVVPVKALIRRDDGEYIFIKSDKSAKSYKRVKVDVQNRTDKIMAINKDILGGKSEVQVITEGSILINEILDGEAD